MGKVDAKYMELIEKIINPKKWEISYYYDPKPMENTLKRYSFKQKCDFFEFD